MKQVQRLRDLPDKERKELKAKILSCHGKLTAMSTVRTLNVAYPIVYWVWRNNFLIY